MNSRKSSRSSLVDLEEDSTEFGNSEHIDDSLRPTKAIKLEPSTNLTIDNDASEIKLSRAQETLFAATIFELGLKHSSPKVLIPFMSNNSGLSTEHIKSHLQKYRIHKARSTEEFVQFFESFVHDSFRTWNEQKAWANIDERASTRAMAALNRINSESSLTKMKATTSTQNLMEYANSNSSNNRADQSTSSSINNPQTPQQQHQSMSTSTSSSIDNNNTTQSQADEVNRKLHSLLQVHQSLLFANKDDGLQGTVFQSPVNN